MKKLISVLERLYFLPEQQWLDQGIDDGKELSDVVAASLAGGKTVALKLSGADNRVRAMALGFRKSADWEQVANLFHAVQDDLALPAPAISVSGQSGFQLWFSLAEPLAAERAQSFLDGLRRKYLAEMPMASLEFFPPSVASGSATPALITLVPGLDAVSGKWSAFIDPTLGSMFIDEPGLEMAPNMDNQALMLARLKCIAAKDFAAAQALLASHTEGLAKPDTPQGEPADPSSSAPERTRSTLNIGSEFSNPKAFLLAVMNDSSASARQRIKAAKALLPYFANKT